MKAPYATLVGLVIASLGLPACCTSIVCQANRAAMAELACAGEELKVTNLSARVERSPDDDRRILEVTGCGRRGLVACRPTNPSAPERKVRGQAPARPTGLELKWRCEPIAETAVRFLQGASLGGAPER
jgi:hypothetical protein